MQAPPLADGALDELREQLPPLPQWTAQPDGTLCAAASAPSAAVGGALLTAVGPGQGPGPGQGSGLEPPAAVAKQAARLAWVEEQMAAHELHGVSLLPEVRTLHPYVLKGPP